MLSSQVKPKFFLDRCLSIVSKFVERLDPLTYEIVDDSKVLYSLCNTTTKITMDGHPHFYLLRVKNSKGLYLHVDVTIKAPERGASMERNHVFEGISVQFLHGTGKLFCRAEWDVKKKIDKLAHPQPHWHWGYEKGAEEPIGFVADDAAAVEQAWDFMQEAADNQQALPEIDFEELHYSMASKWVSQDAAIEDFAIPKLYNWLQNCIANVIDQYNYQVNKGSFVSSKQW